MRVVEFGSIFEETPEGLYYMDRLRRDASELDQLVPVEVAERIRIQEELAFINGTTVQVSQVGRSPF